MISTYMRMVERLLIFIHASRSRNWELHLSSTEELVRDITSMDRIKYRRMLPVYLAEMYALKRTDPIVFEAFSDGEFAVQTNKIPFTIGMDHRGEQVNKMLKIDGGIVGISRNENARTRFMLSAPIIAEISSSFKDSIGSSKSERRNHHQLTRAYTNRQNDMKFKIGDVLDKCNLDFSKQGDDKMRNFVTNHIFPEEVINDILRVEEIGDEAYKTLVYERLSTNFQKHMSTINKKN